jgi:hypothetical protein
MPAPEFSSIGNLHKFSNQILKSFVQLFYPKTIDNPHPLCYNKYVIKLRKEVIKMTKIKRDYLGKQYEIIVSVDEFDTVWVSVSEVIRPTWKIFRTRYIDRRLKFLDDFHSVEDAVNTSFLQIMAQEKQKADNRKKIKEFEEKY